MVTASILKDYDFNSIEDYFGYILASQNNGNISQVETLFKKMSKEQRKECLNYLVAGLVPDKLNSPQTNIYETLKTCISEIYYSGKR